MPFTFTLPKLSPTMEEGTIVKWHKKEGEFVKSGELLLEVATDKATVEHSALDESWLRRILIAEGGSAVVNQAIAIFSVQKDEDIENYKAEGVLPEEVASIAPQIDEKVQDVSFKPQTAQIGLQQPAFIPEPPLKDFDPTRLDEEGSYGKILASPLAKRIAKEKNLDLSTVSGSGPHGRISLKDLEKAQPNTAVAFGRKQKPLIAPGSFEESTLSPMRKVIARRLQESKSFIPHFYVKQTINAQGIFDLREQLKNLDIKISFNDMIIRACALALRDHPEINCGYNSINQTQISFKTVDISVAVSLPTGLITPIIRHADFKNLGEIASEVRYLAKRARDGKLEEREYKGGSFSISNLGMFGITEFNAVINPPQGAILAVGGIEDQPIIKNNQVIAGKTLNLTLSIDHRIIDGEPASRFLKSIQKYLENPVSLTI